MLCPKDNKTVGTTTCFGERLNMFLSDLSDQLPPCTWYRSLLLVDKKAAEENYNSLKKAIKSRNEGDWKVEDFRRQEVEAWVDFAKGKHDKAVKRMRAAADKQDNDDPGGFNAPLYELRGF